VVDRHPTEAGLLLGFGSLITLRSGPKQFCL
jgi:hypothetical protein